MAEHYTIVPFMVSEFAEKGYPQPIDVHRLQCLKLIGRSCDPHYWMVGLSLGQQVNRSSRRIDILYNAPLHIEESSVATTKSDSKQGNDCSLESNQSPWNGK